MKSIIILVLFIYINVAGSQCIYWEQQIFPQRGTVKTIQFFDANTGYTVCAGSTNYGEWNFIKTTNGGTNWVDAGSGIHQSLESLSFINEVTGYAGGLNYLARTTNGGTNWTQLNIGSNNPLGVYSYLRFFDINFGYVYGMSGGIKILRTNNSTMSWDTLLHIFNPYISNVNAFTVLNKDTIIVAGSRTFDLGFVKVTHNGGLSWLLIDSLQLPVSGASFLDGSNGILCATDGVAVLANGRYFLTTNAGLNWVLKETGYNIAFSKSKYINLNTYFFIDWNGGLYFTTNSGLNWTFRDCFNFGAGSPSFISFINQQTGWVGGHFGPYTSAMFKTTNGGLTFMSQNTGFIRESFSLSQNYPNPFNPVTNVRFEIPQSKTSQRDVSTRLIVYDLLGREIAQLVNQQMQAGSYSVDWDASNYPSGVYFYKIIVGDNTNNGGFVESKKMVLVK